MDPTAMMNPMGFGPGMVGGMGPGFGVGPRGFGEKVFPVVRLRGLPFNAGEFDILEFFQGLDPVDVLIVRRDGRATGEAYVLFANPMQMDFALQKNRGPMGRRYIEVFRSKKQDYYHAVANAVNEPAPPTDFYGGGVDGMQGGAAAAGFGVGGAPPVPHGAPVAAQAAAGAHGRAQDAGTAVQRDQGRHHHLLRRSRAQRHRAVDPRLHPHRHLARRQAERHGLRGVRVG